MPGYSILEIDKQKLEDKFLCEYCGTALRDAVRAGCGHFFCSSCVQRLFRNPGAVTVCEKSRRPLFYYEFSQDERFSNKVLSSIVHCLFLESGCIWKGRLREFEDHVANCTFGSIHKREQKEHNGDEKHCTGLEDKGNSLPSRPRLEDLHMGDAVPGKCNEIRHSQNLQNHSSTCDPLNARIPCVYPECGIMVNRADLAEHLEKECAYSLETRSREEQGTVNAVKKGQLNVTLPLQRQVSFLLSANIEGKNRNSRENSTEFKEMAFMRNTSSRNFPDVTDQHEQRLNDLEHKVAQHDQLIKENLLLKEDIDRLTNAFHDVSNKVDHIQRTLVCQQKYYDAFQAKFNSLQTEQTILQSRFDRLLATPLQPGELARLTRNMEVIQERIRRLEEHSQSHGTMLANISVSVTALANAVRHVRILGVDIGPV